MRPLIATTTLVTFLSKDLADIWLTTVYYKHRKSFF